jgi:hypothetical protein
MPTCLLKRKSNAIHFGNLQSPLFLFTIGPTADTSFSDYNARSYSCKQQDSESFPPIVLTTMKHMPNPGFQSKPMSSQEFDVNGKPIHQLDRTEFVERCQY